MGDVGNINDKGERGRSVEGSRLVIPSAGG